MNPAVLRHGVAETKNDEKREELDLLFRQFFNGHPYAITGFYRMAFWYVDVKPESIWRILCRVLGHQAILEVIDISNEFDLRFKLQ